MEQKEKFGNDQEGFSRRRLSSILKAPRPSVKVFGNEQDENQIPQEETRSIEKPRRSRRVSFATTNNIHVFPKEVKADLVLAPIQNVTVGADDGANEKLQCFDPSEKREIMGLDTMLTNPYSFTLEKENYFPEPVLTDCVDRTVILGENSGLMDMTCSQTIVINTESEFNPELALNASNAIEPHKLHSSQNSMPRKSSAPTDKTAAHSGFGDFLACLAKTSGQNTAWIPPRNSEAFPLENIRHAKADKENLLPGGLNKSALFARDVTDMTISHTVSLKERDVLQPFPYSLGGSCRNDTSSYFDDMEITRSQTSAIDFKGLGSANQSASHTDRKKCTFACDDNSEMIMTEVLDVQEPVPEQTGAERFRANVSSAPEADMEMTQPHAVFPETQYIGDPFSNPPFVASTADRRTTDSTQLGNLSRRVLAAGSSEEGKTNVTLPTNSALHDQSDFMELTCQNTGVWSARPDDSVFTGGDNMAAISPMDSRPRAPFTTPLSPDVKRGDRFKSALSHSDTVDDMEITQCHTVCADPERTQHTACNDMEFTECQTVETKICQDYKPPERSKKRLSLMASCKTEAVSREDTGHLELTRSSFLKRPKTESFAAPAKQMFLNQDRAAFPQGTVSAVPFIHDDMDLTGYNNTTINAKTSPVNKASWEFSSRTEELLGQFGGSFPSQATQCKLPVPGLPLDAGCCVDVRKSETLDFSGMDLTKVQEADPKGFGDINELNSTVTKSGEETCNMEMTRAFTMPLEEQCNMGLVQEEMANDKPAPVIADQPTAINESMSFTENQDCVFDTLKDEHSSAIISRRKSLADLHKKIKTISQYIREPDAPVAGSVTAPVLNFSLVSPVEKESESPSSETRPPEPKASSAHKECPTPFGLKNSLMARLSVGAVVPKFPPRLRSASPNETEPKSPGEFRGVRVQTCAGGDLHNEIDLMDEVLPEDDFSGTLISNLSKVKEQEDRLNDDPIAYERTECVMDTSQAEKTPPEVKDATVTNTRQTMRDSTSAPPYPPTHVVKITEDSHSSSNSTMMKCEGISELTLRNSQLDSQLEGTMDHELDFYKKLEDGSVTVNEFLTHFGAKFVIHRSRPSSLPDNLKPAQTYTMDDLLTEKYIHRPKQKVYETDCQKLSEMVEGFKIQMADQEKPVGSFNPTLLKDICLFSKEQLQQFSAKLKERRVYFRKRSKALSHKMKENLYSDLLKMAQEAKQSLVCKIEETNEMLKDLDVCINDMESELIGMNNIATGDQHSDRREPVLKAKQEELEALNSDVTEKEKQIFNLELQAQSLEDTWVKVQAETRELQYHASNLNSLNEWRVIPGNENGLVFTFLHDTVHLEVKPKQDTGKECMHEDKEQDVDVAFTSLLKAEVSQPSAVLIHKLLRQNIDSQMTRMQKYSTTRCIPMLLHDVGLAVSRLRLLGEEIHRLEKWGSLRLGILHIRCVDSLVEVVFSSIRAFVKFELRLVVTPDYPFSPLQLHNFQNHIGGTSLEQIQDIVSSVRPAKNYLTKVLKRIHSNLLI